MNLAVSTLLLAVSSLSAATHYVSLESTNPTPPHTNWATAATSIQDAVDAAQAGETVIVTNGVYALGATETFDTNGLWMGFSRVVVSNAISLQSVHGPAVTVIDGGGTNRCVSLTDGASMTGFTLTNGHTSFAGGGVSCTSTNAFVTNCIIAGNSVQAGLVGYDGSYGGGVHGGTLYDCTLTANSAGVGGGASESTLYNCTLTGNSALGFQVFCPFPGNCPIWPPLGGGAYGSTLSNCTLSGNSASGYWGIAGPPCGGGAAKSALYNCTLNGNSSSGPGGGASESTLYNCTLTGNLAASGGGVAGRCIGQGVYPIYDYPSALYNCTLTGNSATYGGGAAGGALYNCTVVDNLASDSGGGVAASALANCILAYNAAWTDDNYTADSTVNYCCTVPLPTNGFGNISVPPLLVDYATGNLRLQSNSPCINSGNNAFVTTATDLDGNARIMSGTVDIGAYENQGTGSRISYAWLQQYGLPTDGSADFIDSDSDGLNTWQEWVCGTRPTNSFSALRMVSASPARTNVTVTWESVAGVNYFLERSANLASPFTLLATNIVGQPGTTSYADTNVIGAWLFFYRVGLSSP